MGYIKIVIAILIWSSLGIFVRKIGLPNTVIVFYSCAIAGLLQLLLLSLTGQMKKNLCIDGRRNRILLFVAFPLSSLANVLLFYFAFTHTTIANAVLSHYTAPIFVAVMAPFFLKEKNHHTTWIAIILSSIGLWLMLWMPSSGKGMSTGSSDTQGIIAGALSGFAYALIILIIRSIASRYISLFIIFIQNSVMAVLLLPFISGTTVPMNSFLYLAAMGIIHSTIAPIIYVEGFKSTKANEAAILGYFEPVGATVLALVFLNEVPGLFALIGGALILCSGYLVLKFRRD
ncbi:MAG: hypothetical protein C4560_07075 [Nitrospiraceae bacterium]|nr:MAG: hypothetical protein C4560_07075 [Nitrospiraceae bacterium]